MSSPYNSPSGAKKNKRDHSTASTKEPGSESPEKVHIVSRESFPIRAVRDTFEESLGEGTHVTVVDKKAEAPGLMFPKIFEDLAEMKKNMGVLKSEVKKIEGLEKKIEGLEKKVEGLEKSNAELTEKVEGLEKSNAELTEKVEGLTSLLGDEREQRNVQVGRQAAELQKSQSAFTVLSTAVSAAAQAYVEALE